LVLPSGTSIGKSDIENICQIVRLAIINSQDINRKMNDLRSA
jgi:hypothetical protein